MNEEAQAKAYAEADFAEPHNHCIELLAECLPDLPASGAAADLGCGPGDISRRFARAFPSWTVDGLDGSAAMLRFGHEEVLRSGLSDRVRLIECYLPNGDAPREHYDLVFSNALLHHLAEPTVLWTSVRRWSRAGGPVFVMDLLRPESREQARHLVEQYSGNEPEVLKHDFYNSLLASYSVDEVRSQLTASGLPHLEVRQSSDRHLIVWGII